MQSHCAGHSWDAISGLVEEPVPHSTTAKKVETPRRCSRPRSWVSLCLLSLLLWGSSQPEQTARADWPQFRGANCVGIAAEAQNLPVEFSDEQNVRWVQDVGEGIGCPIVVDGRVFVSGMTGEQEVTLLAFEARTGKPLWRRSWETGPLPEIHRTNSHASSTPAADNERVYFYFSSLGLLTVDARTGEDVWKQELPVPFFVFKWGAGMSPVLYEDLVIFCQDDDLQPVVYAFDKTTGQQRWKDDRFDMAVNYSHPVVNRVNDQDEIVIAGTGMLIGYDPQTGSRRWFARTLPRNIKTTPVCRDGVVYISVQSGGIANQWLVSVDQAPTGNKDGKIDREEIQAFVGDFPIPEEFFERTFGRGDLNRDGFLEGKELDIAFLHPDNFAGADYTQSGDAAAEEYVLAVRGGGQGDVTETHLLWKHSTKHTDHLVSPYVAGSRMLLVKSGGILTSFQLSDGTPLDRPRRVGHAATYIGSPVGGDGKLYLTAETGVITVLRDDESLEQLAINDLGESTVSTPAIYQDALFVRTRNKLFCLAVEE